MNSKLELQILISLRRVAPRMLPRDVLLAEVRAASADAPTKAEFDFAVTELEAKGQLIRVKDEDRERVKITAAGIARHAEAQT